MDTGKLIVVQEIFEVYKFSWTNKFSSTSDGQPQFPQISDHTLQDRTPWYTVCYNQQGAPRSAKTALSMGNSVE